MFWTIEAQRSLRGKALTRDMVSGGIPRCPLWCTAPKRSQPGVILHQLGARQFQQVYTFLLTTAVAPARLSRLVAEDSLLTNYPAPTRLAINE